MLNPHFPPPPPPPIFYPHLPSPAPLDTVLVRGFQSTTLYAAATKWIGDFRACKDHAHVFFFVTTRYIRVTTRNIKVGVNLFRGGEGGGVTNLYLFPFSVSQRAKPFPVVASVTTFGI